MQLPVRSNGLVTIGLLSIALCGTALLNGRSYEYRKSKRTATARGHAFLNDPADRSYREVELHRLNGDGSVLDGEFVRVSSARLQPDGSPLASVDGSGDFRFEPVLADSSDCVRVIEDCSPFDLVNVYYHIDRFAREFWEDRLGIDIEFQAHAVAHLAGDGALAIARDNTIKFRLGSLFMKNAALEDEVIYHEYTHLVTWHLGFRADTASSTETRALNEGFAHYFSAGYTEDPHIGEWLVSCPDRRDCMGPLNARDLVTLETDPSVWNWNNGAPAPGLRYGACTRFHEDDGKCKTSYNNFDPQYVWSIILGSALWDLSQIVGSDVVDRLLVSAIHEADGFWTFSRALEALLRADEALYSGTHVESIITVFDTRGIRTTVDTALDEDDREPRKAALEATVTPNPTSGRSRIVVRSGRDQRLLVAVYDALGRRMAVVADDVYRRGSHSFWWPEGPVPSGQYRIVVSGDGRTVSVPMVIVR